MSESKQSIEVTTKAGSGFGTKALHAGQDPEPTTGAVVVPISLATTFAQASPGVHKGYDYSRSGNPTRNAFEQQVAALENGKHGLAFASGLAATTTITTMLKSGDHIICGDDVYGGTNRFLSRIAAPSFGIQTCMVDANVPGAVEAAIKPNTKIVWLETPTNPNLKLFDIAAVAEVTKKHGLIFVVDNTFMSPYFQRPLELGADLVVHSVTKYLNGHSDVVGGIILTNRDDLHERLRFLQYAVGAVPAPFDCYMAMRGVKTLHIRMREHARNAMAVAQFLESAPQVEKVVYPGLPSHPQHELAKKQMKGFGGMVTFYLKGGLKESQIFLENLHLFACAESLGAVESLADHPAIMTHASVPEDQRKVLGISDSMVRLSVGLEDTEDILADLKNALAAIDKKAAEPGAAEKSA